MEGRQDSLMHVQTDSSRGQIIPDFLFIVSVFNLPTIDFHCLYLQWKVCWFVFEIVMYGSRLLFGVGGIYVLQPGFLILKKCKEKLKLPHRNQNYQLDLAENINYG